MQRMRRALIDLKALQHNVQHIRRCAPQQRIMAVIKANAYGHGSLAIAQALAQQVDGLAVCCLEEAIGLRQQGIRLPILLLEGFFSAAELPIIAEHDLHIALHHPQQLGYLRAAQLPRPIKIWLKVDTGMHRLGFLPAQFAEVWDTLYHLSQVQPFAVMTHLACADERDSPHTQQQLQQFDILTQPLSVTRSIANSAGILAWQAAHADWVRPGIMLYGVSPFADTVAADEGLQAVMQLHSQLISVKQCRAGDTISYGATWRCPTDMLVGVVAIGYADGYPRHVPSGTPVWLNGATVPLIGRVTMDMIMVDLRSQPQAQIGDKVELWGQQLPVETIAQHAGTIPYELLCNVGQRVERVLV